MPREILAAKTFDFAQVMNTKNAKTNNNVHTTIEPAPDTIKVPLLNGPGLAVAWSGHATVLIQIDDKTFITDSIISATEV